MRPPQRRASRLLPLAVVLLLAAGCGGSSAPPTAPPGVRPQPDLDAFLRLPVATPSSCSEGENGATSGRRSPWVGTVDISVFLDDMSPRALIELQDKVNRIGDVKRVYYESKDQAWAEFQRLYTCSEQVGRDAVPASLRIVLFTMTRTERDDLVRRLQALPGVASVSCDPSTPCTDVQASES